MLSLVIYVGFSSVSFLQLLEITFFVGKHLYNKPAGRKFAELYLYNYPCTADQSVIPYTYFLFKQSLHIDHVTT
jgi:hypothetical protein